MTRMIWLWCGVMTEPQDVTVIWNGQQYDAYLLNGFVSVHKRKTTYGSPVSNTSKSIQETIWDELDDVMDLMMEGRPKTHQEIDSFIEDIDWTKFQKDWQQFGKWQGIAEALCLVICLFENPHHPDIDSVKGEAVLRYKRRQEAVELNSMEEEAPNVVREEAAADSSVNSDPVDATN